MTVATRFNIDVYDNLDRLVGPGPLFNILSVTHEEALDLAGKVTVTVPVTDPRVSELVSNERRVGVRTKDGIVAYGVMQEIAHSLNPMTTNISGPDRLGELLYLNTQTQREYNNLATSAIIGTTGSGTGLLRETGWVPGAVSPSVTPTTISYETQTILQALITLAKQTGDHFREGSTPRTLDWGVFGARSGYQFLSPNQVTSEQTADNPWLVYINQLNVGTVTSDIENRVYPVGQSGFTMEEASSACTEIKVRANRGPLGETTLLVGAHGAGTTTWSVTPGTGTSFTPGERIWIGSPTAWANNHEVLTVQSVAANSITTTSGSTLAYTGGESVVQRFLFYVEDGDSQTTYGVRENAPQFSWIKPCDETSTTDRQQAADVLYYAALARLLRYKSAYTVVELPEVFNVPPPSSLRVGDKVRITARLKKAGGGGYAFNIDSLFYVLRISRTWTGEGVFSASLEVADVSRPTPNNVDLLVYNLDTNQWMGPR